MAAIQLPLVGVDNGDGKERSIGASRLVNCYAQETPDNPKGRFGIVGSPGLAAFSTRNSSPCRNLTFIPQSERLLSAHDGEIIEIASDGTSSIVATLPGSGRVFSATNQATTPETAYVTGAGIYILSGNSIAPLINSELSGVNSVAYLKGRTIYTRPDGRFYWSGIYDAKMVSALSYATAETRSDKLLLAFVTRNELWLFGTDTVEVWRPSDDADLPFSNLSGAHFNVGTNSPHTICEFDNSPTWVDNLNRVVRAGAGYVAQRISTNEVENRIERLVDKTQLFAFSYVLGGHYFYVLTSPEWTVVFDAATQKWHMRKSNLLDNWRCNHAIDAFGKTIFGDMVGGGTLVHDRNDRRELGQSLVATFSTPIVSSFPNGGIIDEFALDIDVGVGLDVLSVNDAQIMLRTSKDSGATWGSHRQAGLYGRGEYRHGVKWSRLGQFGRRGVQFEVSVSDPVPFCVMASSAEIRPIRAP